MYPASTSLIPIQIALARFLESHGWREIFQNYLSAGSGLYPYWYLGTTPFRYLTGPVLPLVLVGLHRVLPLFSLFEIMFGVIGVMWAIGGLGVVRLVKTLISAEGEHRSVPVLAGLFFFFGPIVPLLFRFSDGISLVGFSLIPWILAEYSKFLIKEKANPKQRLLIIGMISLLLLFDISCFISLILGMAAVLLAVSDWKRIEQRIKTSISIITYCLLLVTIWYGPGYWRQVLISPSLAGKSLFSVIGQLGQLLPVTLAISLAIVSGQLVRLSTRLLKFGFYWLFVFGFLSLLRFIADPDFWLDWSNYYLEIQLGLAIMVGLIVEKLGKSRLRPFDAAQGYGGQVGKLGVLGLVGGYLLSFIFLFSRYTLGTLQRDITKSVEYRVGQNLSKMVKPGERVFLSGTTVFWLNAFFDIPQVRGGNDGPSVDRNWRAAAWEIREGTDPEKSVNLLKKLGVKYLLVHTDQSAEYFHDFKNYSKFDQANELKKIFDQDGDKIYKIVD